MGRGERLMAWIDERIWCHPKIVELSDKAFRAYIHGIAYASGMATKGHLSGNQQKLIGAGTRERQELVEAGLWELNGRGASVIVHDWEEHNGKRDERRRKDRERKRQLRMSA